MLLPGTYTQDGASDLKANNWSVPHVFDWNNDGKKDLLVGNRTYDDNKPKSGYISFYENIGSDSEPSFNVAQQIQTCTNICEPLTVLAEG